VDVIAVALQLSAAQRISAIVEQLSSTVADVCVDRAAVRQKKTRQPVRFELAEQTRQAVDNCVRAAAKKPGEFMFTGRRGSGRSITTREYARLVSEWIASIGLVTLICSVPSH
jgi:hypothetical protein